MLLHSRRGAGSNRRQKELPAPEFSVRGAGCLRSPAAPDTPFSTDVLPGDVIRNKANGCGIPALSLNRAQLVHYRTD